MQKVCQVQGGIEAYKADPKMLITAETRKCPFCPDHHPLRCHCHYYRYALFPDREPERVKVYRLLCVQMGRTVSLLPDFCLPRRQHGPAILGYFLQALFLQSFKLMGALRRARPDAPCHAVAQTLRNGFIGRHSFIHEYLESVHAQMIPARRTTPPSKEYLADLVRGLILGFQEVARAFLYHGRCFHNHYELGLA